MRFRKQKALLLLLAVLFLLPGCSGNGADAGQSTAARTAPPAVPTGGEETTGTGEETEASPKEYEMPAIDTVSEMLSADLSVDLGKRTNLSGFLHAWDKYSPATALIDPVMPALHRGGLQDAVMLYKRAQEIVTKPVLMLVVSDRVCTAYPGQFPGKDYSFEFFADDIRSQIRLAVEGGVDMSRVIFDIWNENDDNSTCWNPYGDIRKNRDLFLPTWKTAYDAIKGCDPSYKIAGPCFAHIHDKTEIDTEEYAFFKEWLDYAVKNGCMPDYINWHMLGDSRDPAVVIAEVREIFASRGMTCPPIIMDEVINDTDNSPGVAPWFLGQLQRSDVAYAGHAVWKRSALDQLLYLDDKGHWCTTGEYRMYCVYGTMTGNYTASTPTENLEIIPVVTGDKATLLLGNRGNFTGVAGVEVKGVPYEDYRVSVYKIPYKNGKKVTEEDIALIYQGEYHGNDAVTLTVAWGEPATGYYITLEKQ